jgi:hypothetical protein
MLALFKHIEYDEISKLVKGVKTYKNQREPELSNQYSQIDNDPVLSLSQEYRDSLLVGIENENYLLDESVKLSHRLAVVALYIKLELRINVVCRIAFPELEADQLYKIHYLEKGLKKHSIKIRKLPSFRFFDELRCINNAIKHGGVVGEELAKYSAWVMKDDLLDIDVAYEKLAPGCVSFISELVQAIIDKQAEREANA